MFLKSMHDSSMFCCILLKYLIDSFYFYFLLPFHCVFSFILYKSVLFSCALHIHPSHVPLQILVRTLSTACAVEFFFWIILGFLCSAELYSFILEIPLFFTSDCLLPESLCLGPSRFLTWQFLHYDRESEQINSTVFYFNRWINDGENYRSTSGLQFHTNLTLDAVHSIHRKGLNLNTLSITEMCWVHSSSPPAIVRHTFDEFYYKRLSDVCRLMMLNRCRLWL